MNKTVKPDAVWEKYDEMRQEANRLTQGLEEVLGILGDFGLNRDGKILKAKNRIKELLKGE